MTVSSATYSPTHLLTYSPSHMTQLKRLGRDRFNDSVMEHARRDFVRVSDKHTVGEALAEVQRSQPPGRIVYFYVVDETGRLRGVLPTRRLLLSTPDTPIARIMVTHVITLPETATLLDACELFVMHRLLAFPIIDTEKRMVGVVDVDLYTDEISELTNREESDDVFQLIGVRLAQIQRAPLLTAFARRFPWLLCNIVGGLMCAWLAWQFEDVLERVVILAMFLPVVLTVAESVSIQTLSLALQAHHGQRFRWGEILSALLREIPLGAMLGMACGSAVAIVALAWLGEGQVALSVLFGIILAVTTAAILGLAVPTALLAAHRDPKIASGPIVLSLTDVAALFYYLGLATWLI
jgi:magnesium transporter